jgi:tRNA pseudouridine13 synthase
MTASAEARRTADDEPILKCVPGDFLVREALVAPLGAQEDSPYRWMLLRKQGYTTVEAVDLIAKQLEVSARALTYAGRKDEDGVTEQLIALRADVQDHRLEQQRWLLGVTADQWVELRPYGFAAAPLQVGVLAGNAFRLTVRNLPPVTAERIAAEGEVNMFALNYYDTQRFGAPNGLKRTHMVGAALLEGDWQQALQVLCTLKALDSVAALAWLGEPKDFFVALDDRITSFYLAAKASADWNDCLGELVAKVPHAIHRVEGLEYRYAQSQADTLQVLATAPQIEYPRYSFAEGEVIRNPSTRRPSVVQAAVRVCANESDERHLDRRKVTLEFFLRSGSYATTVVRQLLRYFAQS